MHLPPSPKGYKSNLLKIFLKKHEQVHLCQLSGWKAGEVYTAIKHYHTGKVASSVVMEAQQASSSSSQPALTLFWEVAQKLGA